MSWKSAPSSDSGAAQRNGAAPAPLRAKPTRPRRAPLGGRWSARGPDGFRYSDGELEPALPWTRRVWMTLAALSAMCAAGVATAAALITPPGPVADLMKAGAAIQFMHSMATLACATVVQIGGARARHAPAFFLAAILLLSGSLYAMAAGAAPPNVQAAAMLGALASAAGWIILAAGTLGVDSYTRRAPMPGRGRAAEPARAPALEELP